MFTKELKSRVQYAFGNAFSQFSLGESSKTKMEILDGICHEGGGASRAINLIWRMIF